MSGILWDRYYDLFAHSTPFHVAKPCVSDNCALQTVLLVIQKRSGFFFFESQPWEVGLHWHYYILAWN